MRFSIEHSDIKNVTQEGGGRAGPKKTGQELGESAGRGCPLRVTFTFAGSHAQVLEMRKRVKVGATGGLIYKGNRTSAIVLPVSLLWSIRSSFGTVKGCKEKPSKMETGKKQQYPF